MFIWMSNEIRERGCIFSKNTQSNRTTFSAFSGVLSERTDLISVTLLSTRLFHRERGERADFSKSSPNVEQGGGRDAVSSPLLTVLAKNEREGNGRKWKKETKKERKIDR